MAEMFKKMVFSKRRWIILISLCIINLFVGSIYSWSVFAGPLAEYLTDVTGVKVASLAIVFTVFNTIGPVNNIVSGFLSKKAGPKLVLLIGAFFYGGGFILTGFAQSVGMVIFSYGILSAIGLGLIYGTTVSYAVKFFPDKKGLSGGLTTALYGLCSVLLPPIANALIEKLGVSATYKALGIVFLVVIAAFSLFVCRCPENMAELVNAKKAPAAATGKEKPAAAVPKDKNWKAMLKTPYFYPMMLMLCCGAFGGLMLTSQASLMAQFIIGSTPAAAAVIVSILALFNVFGRILSGIMSDKKGPRMTLRAGFVVLFIGVVLLFIPVAVRTVPFIIGIMCVGLCFGAAMGVFPGFTASVFGAGNNEVNYNIMFIGFGIAGLTAPMIASSLFASSGSYQMAFIVSGILAVIGFALTFIKEPAD